MMVASTRAPADDTRYDDEDAGGRLADTPSGIDESAISSDALGRALSPFVDAASAGGGRIPLMDDMAMDVAGDHAASASVSEATGRQDHYTNCHDQLPPSGRHDTIEGLRRGGIEIVQPSKKPRPASPPSYKQQS